MTEKGESPPAPFQSLIKGNTRGWGHMYCKGHMEAGGGAMLSVWPENRMGLAGRATHSCSAQKFGSGDLN